MATSSARENPVVQVDEIGKDHIPSNLPSHFLVSTRLDDFISPIKGSTRIRYVCLSANACLVALGTNTGVIYVFSRQTKRCLHVLLPDTEGSITKVCLDGTGDLIAYATSKGYVAVINLQAKPKKLCHTYNHVGATVTYIHWSSDGDLIYVGDQEGKVTRITLNLHTSNADSSFLRPVCEMLIILDSAVIQIDTFSNTHILISTRLKSIICFTEKGIFTIIGTKPRDGVYGGCFFPFPKEELLMFCSRPGSRVWEGRMDGQVTRTHQFKALLDISPTPILDSSDFDMSKMFLTKEGEGSQSVQFPQLYVSSHKHIVTWSSSTLYILDPKAVEVVLWSKLDSDFHESCFTDDTIFLLESSGCIQMIEILRPGGIIARAHSLKQLNTCADLLNRYMDTYRRESGGIASVGSELDGIDSKVVEEVMYNVDNSSEMIQQLIQVLKQKERLHNETKTDNIIEICKNGNGRGTQKTVDISKLEDGGIIKAIGSKMNVTGYLKPSVELNEAIKRCEILQDSPSNAMSPEVDIVLPMTSPIEEARKEREKTEKEKKRKKVRASLVEIGEVSARKEKNQGQTIHQAAHPQSDIQMKQNAIVKEAQTKRNKRESLVIQKSRDLENGFPTCQNPLDILDNRAEMNLSQESDNRQADRDEKMNGNGATGDILQKYQDHKITELDRRIGRKKETLPSSELSAIKKECNKTEIRVGLIAVTEQASQNIETLSISYNVDKMIKILNIWASALHKAFDELQHDKSLNRSETVGNGNCDFNKKDINSEPIHSDQSPLSGVKPGLNCFVGQQKVCSFQDPFQLPLDVLGKCKELGKLCFSFGCHGYFYKMTEPNGNKLSSEDMGEHNLNEDKTKVVHLAQFLQQYFFLFLDNLESVDRIIKNYAGDREYLWNCFTAALLDSTTNDIVTQHIIHNKLEEAIAILMSGIDIHIGHMKAHIKRMFDVNPLRAIEFCIENQGYVTALDVYYTVKHRPDCKESFIIYLRKLVDKNTQPAWSISLERLHQDKELREAVLNSMLSHPPVDISCLCCNCGLPRPGCHLIAWEDEAILRQFVDLGSFSPEQTRMFVSSGYWYGYIKLQHGQKHWEFMQNVLLHLDDLSLLSVNNTTDYKPTSPDAWKQLIQKRIKQNEGATSSTADTKCPLLCLKCGSNLEKSIPSTEKIDKTKHDGIIRTCQNRERITLEALAILMVKNIGVKEGLEIMEADISGHLPISFFTNCVLVTMAQSRHRFSQLRTKSNKDDPVSSRFTVLSPKVHAAIQREKEDNSIYLSSDSSSLEKIFEQLKTRHSGGSLEDITHWGTTLDKSKSCEKCSRQFYLSPEDSNFFNCGHKFHRACMPSEFCPTCQTSHRDQLIF